MTKEQAHEVLNAAKLGALVSRHTITAALMVTGDLSPSHPMPKHIPTWIAPPQSRLPQPEAA